ncbi:hypothetical protein DEH18_21870 [Streptomyces sp. NHF165]|nr:hypothetical protein DEH18_21870 [Streptomyces sp. NHF165]
MRIPRGRAVGHLRGDAEQKAADQEGAAVHVGLLGQFARGDATRHAPRATRRAPRAARSLVRLRSVARCAATVRRTAASSSPGARTVPVRAARQPRGREASGCVSMEPCSSRETASRGLRLRHR